jgi:hypothetical protein
MSLADDSKRIFLADGRLTQKDWHKKADKPIDPSAVIK